MRTLRTDRFKIARANCGKKTALRALAAGPWRKGLNFALEMAKELTPTSAYDLHASPYRALRRFGLPAQLACACRDKAFEAYRSHQELRESDPGRRRFPHFVGVPAIRFNIPRSCRLFTRGTQHWVELTTLQGRIALRVRGKARALARVWKARPTHAEIVFKKDVLFFHVAVTTSVQRPSAADCQTFIGIDFNVLGHLIVAVALSASGTVLSTFWVPAGRFNWKRKHYAVVRTALQRAGAVPGVRRCKNHEHYFVDTFLHEATTRLIRWAGQFSMPFVALEDLRRIRRKASQLKSWNRQLHSWPFGSGQDMVRYKGARHGIRVSVLSGAFSSRYCSRCGSRDTRRSGAAFACQRCGYGLNAHLNGARNMSWRAARYSLAAGRAGDKTAERQSGPCGKHNEERPLSSHTVSLRWPFRVSPKPRTLVRGS